MNDEDIGKLKEGFEWVKHLKPISDDMWKEIKTNKEGKGYLTKAMDKAGFKNNEFNAEPMIVTNYGGIIIYEDNTVPDNMVKVIKVNGEVEWLKLK